MILSALILGATIVGGIGTITIASKNVENEPKTINHINNTVINNNQKITNNNQQTTTMNIKNSMNKTKKINETSDNTKALEEKITQELNRVEDEILEEMLQQFYLNNLESSISEKLNNK